jgi:hypothetical protein
MKKTPGRTTLFSIDSDFVVNDQNSCKRKNSELDVTGTVAVTFEALVE